MSSIPTIAIRFNANADEEEQVSLSKAAMANSSSSDSVNQLPKDTSDVKRSIFSSPIKINKRSSSIDDLENPPSFGASNSERWKIFTELKGKFTKTVEEKINEIKSSNSKLGEAELRQPSVDRDSETVSDAEDTISDNSFSKCIEKTGEVEDACTVPNDTSSIQESKLKKENPNGDKTCASIPLIAPVPPVPPKRRKHKRQAPPKPDNEQIDNASDALDMLSCNESTKPKSTTTPAKPLQLRKLLESYVNEPYERYKPYLILTAVIVAYSALPFSDYVRGLFVGSTLMALGAYVYMQTFCCKPPPVVPLFERNYDRMNVNASIKEFEPIYKYEGWMNEFRRSEYTPANYHIALTHSVFVQLEGAKLKLSSGTNVRVSKRALWNEKPFPPPKRIPFTHHRIYDMSSATVKLLPLGIVRKRLWSKKYPICLEFTKIPIEEQEISDKRLNRLTESFKKKSPKSPKRSKSEADEVDAVEDDGKKLKTPIIVTSDSTTNISKSDSVASDLNSDVSFMDILTTINAPNDLIDEEDEEVFSQAITDWEDVDGDPNVMYRVYLFTRSNRDKEEWYNRFVKATKYETMCKETDSNTSVDGSTSSNLSENVGISAHTALINDYLKLMARFEKTTNEDDGGQSGQNTKSLNFALDDDTLWINALVSRIFFDTIRQKEWIVAVQQKMQKKLSAIRLPYFMEALTMTQINLGTTVPVIRKISTPYVDAQGLWIDFDITYEGSFSGTLETKVNLIKNHQTKGHDLDCAKAVEIDMLNDPIYNSEIEDSAESSTDEDSVNISDYISSENDNKNNSNLPSASTSSTNTKTHRKIFQMVDALAKSKFVRQAAEYSLVKKALAGVQKTELKLEVELCAIVGTLVINIPPPPTHRIWLGFRTNVELWLNAKPIVGEHSINFNHVTSWIEKKLQEEFRKIFVLPNMEDFVIPFLDQQVPS